MEFLEARAEFERRRSLPASDPQAIWDVEDSLGWEGWYVCFEWHGGFIESGKESRARAIQDAIQEHNAELRARELK